VVAPFCIHITYTVVDNLRRPLQSEMEMDSFHKLEAKCVLTVFDLTVYDIDSMSALNNIELLR
jgi:hypothetical protein